MKQKKSLGIKIGIVLLVIIAVLAIIDRIIIIRIRYDEGNHGGHFVDYPDDKQLNITKGYGRDSDPYRCIGFKKNMKDGQLFIGVNIVNWDDMSINGASGYFIGDACNVDGQRIVLYYDMYYPERRVHFWKVDLQVFFEEDQDGELHCSLECDNNRIEFAKNGQFYSGTIYR